MSVDPWRATLGYAVRAARDDHGWSLRAAGERSGVPKSTWSRLEAGEVVADHTLIQAEAALGWGRGECFRLMAGHLERLA